MLKNCLIFASGMVVGGYAMYNKIYRMIADIVITSAKKNNESGTAETEKTDN